MVEKFILRTFEFITPNQNSTKLEAFLIDTNKIRVKIYSLYLNNFLSFVN